MSDAAARGRSLWTHLGKPCHKGGFVHFSFFEAPAGIASLDHVAVMGQTSSIAVVIFGVTKQYMMPLSSKG